jgi:hypothetical protein
MMPLNKFSELASFFHVNGLIFKMIKRKREKNSGLGFLSLHYCFDVGLLVVNCL